MAACLRTVKHNQASFLKNSAPIYVHCVSEDNFPIDSVSFHLCEADLSQSQPERRVGLVPVVLDESKIDDIFTKDVKALLSSVLFFHVIQR